MNVKEIKELVDMVARRGLAGLEVERAGFRLRIEGPRPEAVRTVSHAVLQPSEAADGVPMALPVAAPVAARVEAGHRPAPVDDGLHVVTSPIVGTFYRSPSPDADPFVKTGDNVEKGQTLCIVEAMKLMNEIEAEVEGKVAEFLVKNGEHVEYGQALIRLSPA